MRMSTTLKTAFDRVTSRSNSFSVRVIALQRQALILSKTSRVCGRFFGVVTALCVALHGMFEVFYLRAPCFDLRAET